METKLSKLSDSVTWTIMKMKFKYEYWEEMARSELGTVLGSPVPTTLKKGGARARNQSWAIIFLYKTKYSVQTNNDKNKPDTNG